MDQAPSCDMTFSSVVLLASDAALFTHSLDGASPGKEGLDAIAVKLDIGLLYGIKNRGRSARMTHSLSSVKKASSFRALDLLLEWRSNPPVAGPIPA